MEDMLIIVLICISGLCKHPLESSTRTFLIQFKDDAEPMSASNSFEYLSFHTVFCLPRKDFNTSWSVHVQF